MALKVTTTKRGKPLLTFHGFSYIKDRDGVDSKIIWKCTEYTTKKCLARRHTKLETITWDSDNHCHGPNHANVLLIPIIYPFRINRVDHVERL